MIEPDLQQILADRMAITDVLFRYCRGIDRLDMPLVRSCYFDDAIDHHTGFDGNIDDYVAWLAAGLPRLDGTMHLLGNKLIELDGDRARVETYVTAYHWAQPPDDPNFNFTSYLRYVDKFERRDGEWRIAERWAVREWAQVVPADQVRPKEGDGPSGRRDRTDPVYLAWPTWPGDAR